MPCLSGYQKVSLFISINHPIVKGIISETLKSGFVVDSTETHLDLSKNGRITFSTDWRVIFKNTGQE